MSEKNTPPFTLNRRGLLGGLGGAIAIANLPGRAWADPEDVVAAQKKMFGEGTITEGRIKLKLPPIAENGFSVPIKIDVDSPMTDSDYVKRVALFAERNPLPEIAVFHFTPQSGQATVNTRIRMGGTQTLTAIAEMSDGSLWSGKGKTVVTLAACVVL